MKPLKFAEELVAPTLSGEKTSTWRLFDDKDLRVGDELSLINRDTGEEFAKARITAMVQKPLGEITPEDQVGNGDWEPMPERIATMRTYYGDRVDEATNVKIVTFELV